ncbi:MAG TPA: alpha/beta fold hydrolase [Caulobacteraceae bacterium]|jgi:alpha-beta hydrolase superfamily lysophospholipase|nr:alpha/beta fold hydrolase [Caulobacteraceae bacterium]
MSRLAVLLLALLALGGCASMQVQAPQLAGPGFEGPRLEPDRFISFDGASLGLTRWTPPGDQPWAVIVGVHGMDDYAAAFHLAGPYWAARGIATYAYDQRGFGRAPQRGVWAGDTLMTRDLTTIVALVRARYPHAIVAVAGESLGGAVAIEAFASDHPPDADRVILLAPAVWGWSSQPLSYKLLLNLAARIAPAKVFTPPSFVTEHISASDNIPELEAMGRDPLMIWGARSDALYGLVDTMEHAWREIGQVHGPAFYLLGAKDQIIPRQPALEAAARLPPSDRTAYYAQGWHLLLRDLQAHAVWDDVAAFLKDPNAPLPSGAPPIPVAGRH